MFKVAYCAGHYLGTPGKRVPKELDPNQTREWTLNDRVATYFNLAALEYENVQTLRTDDPTGKRHISIKDRTKKANDFGADLYLDMHHNAGIKLGKGGGVVVYCYPGSEAGRMIQKAAYDAIVTAGGLKGNRSKPLGEKKFETLRRTDMTALLIEYGFMDSRTDHPVISTDSYAKLVAYATMAAVARVYNLKKRADSAAEADAAERLEVDGKWGKATTTRLQEIFGTTADGTISNQHKKYQAQNPGLTSGWDWQDKPNGKGSKLIKAMQKWAGMPESEQDGRIGPKTIQAIQKKLGTTADGKVSKPSQMVKALQRWANEQ